jgi:hypothetical protein
MRDWAAEVEKKPPATEGEDRQQGEQREADDRRRKDELEKLERDSADERGRRSRAGT